MGGALKETQSIVQRGSSNELKARVSSACSTDVSGVYPFDRYATDELAPALFVELLPERRARHLAENPFCQLL